MKDEWIQSGLKGINTNPITMALSDQERRFITTARQLENHPPRLTHRALRWFHTSRMANSSPLTAVNTTAFKACSAAISWLNLEVKPTKMPESPQEQKGGFRKVHGVM